MLTDIYAFDLNPNGSPNNIHLTGLNASNPAIVPLSYEVLSGNPIEGIPNGLATRVSMPGRVRSSLRWPKDPEAGLSSGGLTLTA